jgi:hypothetical protein
MNNKDRSLVGEEFHGWPQLDNLITATITRIRRITHKSVGPEARFRYHFQ